MEFIAVSIMAVGVTLLCGTVTYDIALRKRITTALALIKYPYAVYRELWGQIDEELESVIKQSNKMYKYLTIRMYLAAICIPALGVICLRIAEL